MGINNDLLITRTVRVNARQGLKHPLTDRTKGIVAERVHAGIAKALLLGKAVPAFPDGGGTVFYFIAPGGKLAALQQTHSQVVLTCLAQDR